MENWLFWLSVFLGLPALLAGLGGVYVLWLMARIWWAQRKDAR